MTDDDDPRYRAPPHNEEAEQSLLGAILVNNRAIDPVSEFLKPEHFFDPVHARIYQACLTMTQRGELSNPVTVKRYFSNDSDLKEIGGTDYLARLATSIVSVHNSRDYGRLIFDHFQRRQLIELSENVIRLAYAPTIETTSRDLIEDLEGALFDLAVHGGEQHAIRPIGPAVMDAIFNADALSRGVGQSAGITTGLPDLDRAIGGFQNSAFYVFGARPGMGKTSLLVNTMAVEAARAGFAAGVFELEMKLERLAQRCLAAVSGVHTRNIQRGKINAFDIEQMNDAYHNVLADLGVFVDDNPAVTGQQFFQRARRMARRHKVRALYLDHMQLMQGSATAQKHGDTSVQTEVSRFLKLTAMELDIPVVALSQLNRSVEMRENKRPQLSDLRQSGSIEQDADVVGFLYRHEFYLAKEKPTKRPGQSAQKFQDETDAWDQQMIECANKGELIIEKNRDGPAPKTIELHWNQDTQQFTSLQR